MRLEFSNNQRLGNTRESAGTQATNIEKPRVGGSIPPTPPKFSSANKPVPTSQCQQASANKHLHESPARFAVWGLSTIGHDLLQILRPMGNRKHLREAFFAAHPWCGVCGGTVRASEEDHIPARSLFRRREWPVGYVFPACVDCNRASAIDELAMAWLVRISIGDPDLEGERQMTQCLVRLHDRRPDWVKGMQELSRVETRQYLRQPGLSLEYCNGPARR